MKKIIWAAVGVLVLQMFSQECQAQNYVVPPDAAGAPRDYPILHEYPIVAETTYSTPPLGPIVESYPVDPQFSETSKYVTPYGTIVNPPEPPADTWVFSSDAACGCPEKALFCHYEPECCQEWVCDKKLVKCKRPFCRYVPQYYEVELVRMVPQYYKQMYCRYVPEWSEREEYVPTEEWRCETRTNYVPHYYCCDISCCEEDDQDLYADWYSNQACCYDACQPDEFVDYEYTYD